MIIVILDNILQVLFLFHFVLVHILGSRNSEAKAYFGSLTRSICIANCDAIPLKFFPACVTDYLSIGKLKKKE